MGKVKRYGYFPSEKHANVKELINFGAAKFGNSVAYREIDKYKNFVDNNWYG